MASLTYLCGGDLRPGPRASECPDPLHDWPLPTGYGEANEVAHARLRRGWRNKRCSSCGLYGWVPGIVNAETDVQRPYTTEEADRG